MVNLFIPNLLSHPYRRTGRTFRAILRALEKASSGEQVLYVTPTIGIERHAFDMAFRIVRESIEHQVAKSSSNQKEITFANGGKVRFISGDRGFHDAFRGIRDPIIIEDLD